MSLLTKVNVKVHVCYITTLLNSFPLVFFDVAIALDLTYLLKLFVASGNICVCDDTAKFRRKPAGVFSVVFSHICKFSSRPGISSE